MNVRRFFAGLFARGAARCGSAAKALRPLGLGAASLLVGLATASSVHAGNDDAILMGGYAAMTAGAVTATVSDGSACWYNPAGLARSDRQTLDINASAYGINLISADDLFTLPDGTHSDASVTNWQLIPSALSYTRVLSERTVASFSIIIPNTADADLRTSLSQANGTLWTLGIDRWRNEYDYLATVATSLTDQLRVGLTVGGVYISSEQLVQAGRGQPGVDDTAFLSFSRHRTAGDYALRVGAGVQWSPTSRLDLGLAVQLPALTGYRKINELELNGSALANGAGTSFSSKNTAEMRAVWELSTPLVVRFGAAYNFGRTQLLVDGSVYSRLDSAENNLDRKLSGNARVATLMRLSDRLTVGLGGFTDLNGSRLPGADFLGIAGGVRLAQDYHIAEGGRPLTFFTTLAGRYAYGWGSTTGVRFAAEDAADASAITFTEARLTSHELAFNLGGGVTF